MGRLANGCVVLCCTFLATNLVTLTSSLQTSELPQGLLQQQVDIRITSTLWRVVITVEDDSTQWDDVMLAVNSLIDQNLPRMDEWAQAQLSRLGERIYHLSQSHRRSKRGIIDGVGMLAKSLFGLATDREIGELRSRINENRKFQQKITSWQDELLVVINRTHDEVRQNREVINRITEVTLKSIDAMHLIMTLQDQVHSLERLQRREDEIIDDLDHGMLTELLLPRETLRDIVKDSALPLEWYYRWCPIIPLWGNGWVFETRLPVVSNDPIIGFTFVAFPVWGPHNNTVKLDIATHAVLNTRTGTVSEPRSCRGIDPVVCSPGPTTKSSCAAAVINQHRVAAVCNALRVEEEKRYFSLNENEIIAVFHGPTDIAEVCPDDPGPRRATLARGTHRIQWGAGCRLDTTLFSIAAAQMPVGYRQVESWHIPKGAVNLVQYFNNRTYPQKLPSLIPLDSNRLSMPPVITWTNHQHVGPILALCSIIIIIIKTVLLCWYFWRKYRARSTSGGHEEQEVDSVNEETVGITPVATEASNIPKFQ